MMRGGRHLAILALASVLALTGMLAGGCGTSGGTADDSTQGETIRIGWIPWEEDIAATYLWKRILEDEGYTVELVQLDVAPVFEGVASGDLDLFFDAALPVTHGDYWNEYGDRLEDLGSWYDTVTLNWAVPEYVDIDSIAELAGRENEFDGRIVGIEPGSGLNRISREEVLPTYGLEGYEFVEGSTPAMLAELDRAIRAHDPIVVTLWHPHWAYGAFPVKDLADPEGALGGFGAAHTVAPIGFSAAYPEVAEWVGAFRMDDEQLSDLQLVIFRDYDTGQEEQAIDEWLKNPENRALVDSWLGR